MADQSSVNAPEPRANTRLIGHESAEATLLEAWRSDRLAHAWLITGPRGIGKATLAFRFARFVLAGGGESLEMSADDPIFRRVLAGGHSDFVALTRGTDDRGKRRAEIVIDDVRKANGFLALTPGEGAWRVVVVDAADDLNRNAANALLKLLEEPPRRTLFLLVCHAPSRLLPTVRSRCRVLMLRPLAGPPFDALLSDMTPDLTADDRRALAQIAEGSPGRAIALAEHGGLALFRTFVGLVGEFPQPDPRVLHRLGDGLGGPDGVDRFRSLVELIQWWLARGIARTAREGDEPGGEDEIVPGEAAARARLFTGGRLDHWVGVWDNLNRAFAQAEGLNLDPKQALISAFATLQESARS